MGLAMHLGVGALFLCSATALTSGCADTGKSSLRPGISLGCTNSANSDVGLRRWELTVNTETIEGGKPFTATLDGVGVFEEAFLDAAQDTYSALGGVEVVNVVAFNATVHVRSGATGPDVVLHPEPIPYQCFADRNACDPQNDVLNDPPEPPGLRGNTDCEPVSAINPCGRFVRLPIDTDCDPGGVCAARGKAGPGSQCEANGFCVTGDLRVELQEATGRFTAAPEGTVLFGWDDQSTGAIIDEREPDKGTWILPPSVYEEPTGPNGFRVTVRGHPVAVECTMGVDSQGPRGVDSLHPLSSPTPDSELISFPIQTGAP